MVNSLANHLSVRQPEPMLKVTNAQYGISKQGADILGDSPEERNWEDQDHQFCPWHNEVHLAKEHTFAVRCFQ
jgi:hypothetical protein